MTATPERQLITVMAATIQALGAAQVLHGGLPENEEPAHLCETLRQAVLALTRERGDRLLSSLDHRSYPPASCVCSYDPSAKCSLILASLANAALAEVQAELSNAPALTPERRAYLGQHQDQLTEGIAFLRDL